MSGISIGIDVGGTHTDLIAIEGERAVRAKAFTTHNDYSEGIFVALAAAAAEFDISVDELLSNQVRTFVNGNTIVTNAVTELKGAKVGVLVSGGFGDIVRFGRGNRSNEFDDQLQVNLPQIVAHQCIIEIDERIDRDGNVIIPLERDQVIHFHFVLISFWQGEEFCGAEGGRGAVVFGFAGSFPNIGAFLAKQTKSVPTY